MGYNHKLSLLVGKTLEDHRFLTIMRGILDDHEDPLAP